MYICICNGIRHADIIEAVDANACHTIDDLRRELGVASCCGKCADEAAEIIGSTLQAGAPRRPPVAFWPAPTVEAHSV